MRILHTVELYDPSVGGAQEVVKQISERLVQRGHDVTVATTTRSSRTSEHINGVRIQEFAISGNGVRGFQGNVLDYHEFVRNGQFDVMMNYAAQQWTADLIFPIIHELTCAKVLAPCGFSALHSHQYAKYFAELPDILRQYNMLVFHSNTYQDIQFARSNHLSNMTVIPNGASELEFLALHGNFRAEYKIANDTPIILTVGSHTGLKGHRLAMQAFDQAKIGTAVLVVVGNTKGRCFMSCHARARWISSMSGGKRRVLVLNAPRFEVLAAYEAADLFLFCSNIECSPLVLFEAAASKTPFMSLGCGNAEEIISWTNGGVLIPTTIGNDRTVSARPAMVAQEITKLMADGDKRAKLIEAGYTAWLSSFTWDKITDQYEKLYTELIASVDA